MSEETKNRLAQMQQIIEGIRQGQPQGTSLISACTTLEQIRQELEASLTPAEAETESASK